MGIPVMVLGESGTGKSTSLRNFKGTEVSVINVDGKPFPFPNWKDFRKVAVTDSAAEILGLLQKTTSKAVVVDDAQYIMANEYMRRVNDRGYDKFTEMGSNMFNIIDCVKRLAPDTVVYFLWHTDSSSGTTRAKTIGKMLDEKVTIEGKFTIVLRTSVTDGRYAFRTRNNGFDTVKTPMGMFEGDEIDNDLKMVDERIREYYGFAPLVEAGKKSKGEGEQ